MLPGLGVSSDKSCWIIGPCLGVQDELLRDILKDEEKLSSEVGKTRPFSRGDEEAGKTQRHSNLVPLGCQVDGRKWVQMWL